MTKVANWGNYPKIDAKIYKFDTVDRLKELLKNLEFVIPRGNGRCYGDSALSANIVSTLGFNNIISFDEKNGVISCQAGVLIEELLDVFVPRGWFPPVTPGTKYVSIGGAIASDVHGKNHHKDGSFSNVLIRMEIMLEDGTVVSCSKEENGDLYWATCGGMGLTGMILNATFAMKSIETAYIRQESCRARDLNEIMDMFDQSEKWAYSVAWIDCLSSGSGLGRSILMLGEHASVDYLKQRDKKLALAPLYLKKKPKVNVPFEWPDNFINGLTVRAFNSLYFNKHPARKVQSHIGYDSFFYPLDSLTNWNRIYGRKGFTQYQFVLPWKNSHQGLTKILGKIVEKGVGSPLAVLKLFGKQEGLICFPMEGYTLALDFPIKPGIFRFLNELDKIVLDCGGRLYLTKDVRMGAEMFNKSNPKSDKFSAEIKKIDKGYKFRSLQSKRIGVTE